MNKRFLTPKERQERMQKLLDHYGWSWYHLSQLMGRGLNSLQNSFYVGKGASDKMSLETIMLAAESLGVTVGFLVDRREKPSKCPHCGRKL